VSCDGARIGEIYANVSSNRIGDRASSERSVLQWK